MFLYRIFCCFIIVFLSAYLIGQVESGDSSRSNIRPIQPLTFPGSDRQQQQSRPGNSLYPALRPIIPRRSYTNTISSYPLNQPAPWTHDLVPPNPSFRRSQPLTPILPKRPHDDTGYTSSFSQPLQWPALTRSVPHTPGLASQNLRYPSSYSIGAQERINLPPNKRGRTSPETAQADLYDNLASSYRNLDETWRGRKGNLEVNHVPPDAAYKNTPYEHIRYRDKPTLMMLYDDHRKASSTISE
ncbi:unnamed protein product, partial [Adineta ricciae]